MRWLQDRLGQGWSRLRWSCRAWTVGIWLATPSSLLAQGAGLVPGSRGATLVGAIIDSIRGGPLIGAVVDVSAPVPRQATTDSTGRFRIDSIPPGRYRVGVFDPMLDSLHVGMATAPIQFEEGQTATVLLATPSAARLVVGLCGPGAVSAFADSGVVVLVGRVVDASTSNHPVQGATVEVVWSTVRVSRDSGLRHVTGERRTVTTASGSFLFCSLPGQLRGTLIAAPSGGGHDTAQGAITRPLELRGQALTAITLRMPVTGDSGATRAFVPHIAGRVLSANGSPVAGAHITVLGSSDTVTSSDSGGFALDHLAPGTRTLLVKRIGFADSKLAVDVLADRPTRVTVMLAEGVRVLPSVVTTGQMRAGLQKVGFDRRRRAGAGQYMDSSQIEARHAAGFVQLLEGVGQGLRVIYQGDQPPLITGSRGVIGGTCVTYFVDGTAIDVRTGYDVENLPHPQDIAGIEIYSAADTPPEFYTKYAPDSGKTVNAFGFQAGPTGRCTTVVVWTRAYVDTK